MLPFTALTTERYDTDFAPGFPCSNPSTSYDFPVKHVQITFKWKLHWMRRWALKHKFNL